ncbi:hypothetical protein A2U01_0077665 [Trifolium medium]|uniref:Uncharacterized protein n=1 Tax=Trifolium medium TaxID=97028 RepID=A0A392T7B8_9FABA|nr:hypothetical protein [Trifolium medium]
MRFFLRMDHCDDEDDPFSYHDRGGYFFFFFLLLGESYPCYHYWSHANGIHLIPSLPASHPLLPLLPLLSFPLGGGRFCSSWCG